MRRKRTNNDCAVINTEQLARKRAEDYLRQHKFVKFSYVAHKKTTSCWFVNFSGFCPLHKREHKGNHFYVIVPFTADKPCKFACHDEDEGGKFLSSILSEDDFRCGLRHPLPNYLSSKAFEWEAFIHLVRASRLDNYKGAIDYLNLFALYVEPDDRVLLHVGKKKFTYNKLGDFDSDMHKWWTDRNVIKGFRCDAKITEMKGFVWHLPHDCEIWHDLDLAFLDRTTHPMAAHCILVPDSKGLSWEKI